MTAWIRTYLLIIRNADKATANSRMALIDPDTGGARTFDYMPLATAAAGPTGATVAWGVITRATQAMVDKYASDVADLVAAGKLAIYRIDNGTWTEATALADVTKKPAALVWKQTAGQL